FVELSGEFIALMFGEVLGEGASLSMKVEEENTPAVSDGCRVAAEMGVDIALRYLNYSLNMG
nr:hypothetical protein [Tanacetum cinerariifolium]